MNGKRARGFAVALAILLAGLPRSSQAQWQGAGEQLSVGDASISGYTCTSCPEPYVGAMIPDGFGGAIIAWSEKRATSYDIYAQRLDASGVPLWTAGGVPLCLAQRDQSMPVITSDGASGAIIAWLDNRDGLLSRLYVQHVSDGAVQWQSDGVQLCTAVGDEYWPCIVSDQAGGAIVCWQDSRGGYTTPDIYGQRITASGSIAPGWADTGVVICEYPNTQQLPQAVSDGSGGIIVVWQDFRSGTGVDSDNYAQHLTGSGSLAPGWAANGNPVASHQRYQLIPSITTDGAGGAIIAWEDTRLDVYGDVFVQRMDGSGVRSWGVDGVPLTANDGQGQYHPVLAPDGSGGAFVVWEATTNATGQDIYSQHVDASGSPQWVSGGIALCSAPEYQSNPQLAADGTGGAIVAWTDQRAGFPNPPRVYVQRVGPSGDVNWVADGVRVCTSDDGQQFQKLIPDMNGGAIATWLEGTDVLAGRVSEGGAVPVLPSLVEADATSHRVWLTWYDAARVISTANVERSEGFGIWDKVGQIEPDGSGRLTFVDESVRSGARLGYRLAFLTAHGTEHSPETWVTIPGAATLALEGALPNPAHSPLRLFFRLPDQQPARVELIDVRGRLVARREVGSLGAGRHSIGFDAESVPPGVYRARLVREGRTLVNPVTLLP